MKKMAKYVRCRLYSESRVRFLSNESTGTVGHVVGKLGRLGYTGIREEDVITPAPTAAEYCKRNGLRPHLLVHPGKLSLSIIILISK